MRPDDPDGAFDGLTGGAFFVHRGPLDVFGCDGSTNTYLRYRGDFLQGISELRRSRLGHGSE